MATLHQNRCYKEGIQRRLFNLSRDTAEPSEVPANVYSTLWPRAYKGLVCGIRPYIVHGIGMVMPSEAFGSIRSRDEQKVGEIFVPFYVEIKWTPSCFLNEISLENSYGSDKKTYSYGQKSEESRFSRPVNIYRFPITFQINFVVV